MAPPPQHVFVYGLLMKGEPLHDRLQGATFVAHATVRGSLWSFGRYPGLTDGEGDVRGELYRFDDLPAALEILDDTEEYDPADPQGSLYVRAERVARSQDGVDVIAWVYLYNRATGDAVRIPGGDWRAFQATRR